jgi:hypothetical protein
MIVFDYRDRSVQIHRNENGYRLERKAMTVERTLSILAIIIVCVLAFCLGLLDMDSSDGSRTTNWGSPLRHLERESE